jgi:hypothetical protein
MTQATAHLQKIHTYVKEIGEELALLPPHYAAADWMREVVTATSDCIALYASTALSDAETGRSLPELLRKTRDLQLAWFSELQEQCTLTAIRDLGAVFSRLNRVLEEIEQADYAAVSAARQQIPAKSVRPLRFRRKTGMGVSSKL